MLSGIGQATRRPKKVQIEYPREDDLRIIQTTIS